MNSRCPSYRPPKMLYIYPLYYRLIFNARIIRKPHPLLWSLSSRMLLSMHSLMICIYVLNVLYHLIKVWLLIDRNLWQLHLIIPSLFYVVFFTLRITLNLFLLIFFCCSRNSWNDPNMHSVRQVWKILRFKLVYSPNDSLRYST